MMLVTVAGMDDLQRVAVLRECRFFPNNFQLSNFIDTFPVAAASMPPCPQRILMPESKSTSLFAWLGTISTSLKKFSSLFAAKELTTPMEVIETEPTKLASVLIGMGMDEVQAVLVLQACNAFSTNWQMALAVDTFAKNAAACKEEK